MSKKIRSLKDRMAKQWGRRSWKDALEACLELRELCPGDERILLRLGELYERLGQVEQAVSAFKEVVELYADDGRFARAISVAKRISALDPTDDSVNKRLALLYSARGLPVSPRTLVAPPDALREDAPLASPAAESGVSSDEKETVEEIGLEDVGASQGDSSKRPRRKLRESELREMDLSEMDLGQVEMEVIEAREYPVTPLFFHLAPEELHEVMQGMHPVKVKPGQSIVSQGDEGDSVYLLCEGKVRVRVRRPDGAEVEVAVLGEGDFFGEFGVFTDGRRHATVVADGAVELLELHQSELEKVAKRHPRVRLVLHQYYRDRAVETALAVSKLFGKLDAKSRLDIAGMIEEVTYAAGQMVMQEGAEPPGLYLVRRGRLLVRTESLSGKAVLLAELEPGDFFGEVSALTGSSVTADVIAFEPCELLKLSPGRIQEISERWPQMQSELESVRDRRIHETIERLGTAGPI